MNRVHRLSLVAAALCACFVTSPARAQFPNLVDLSSQYLPSVPVEEPRPVRAQLTTYDVSLNVPLQLGERTYLIPGLGYHVDAVSFENVPAGFTELRALHSLEASLLLVHMLSPDWSLSFRLGPGVAGDFTGFDSGMMRLSAVALATHTFSERLVFGGGALATYAFGTLLPLPALYLDWYATRHLRIETFVPAFLNVTYTLWDRVEIGGRAEVAGNAYAIRDPGIASTWPCAGQPEDDPATAEDETQALPAQCFDHMAYSVGSAGALLGVRLFSSVWLNAFVGHTFYRRFEQMNDSDDRIAGGVQDLPNTWLVRAGLTWRIPND